MAVLHPWWRKPGFYMWLILIIYISSGLELFSNTQTHSNKRGTHQFSENSQLLAEKFEKRKNHLNDFCGPKSSETVYKFMARNPHYLNNIMVDHEYKILYCYVPKVACTNWKKVFLLLRDGVSNHPSIDKIVPLSVHQAMFPTLNSMSEEVILEALRTYHKFMFVRHPMERLVSAFRNKFEKSFQTSIDFQIKFGIPILTKYRNRSYEGEGKGVKFSEFIQYLIDEPKHMNEHWASYDRLCHPCRIRYHLIGKYDSLIDDAEFILKTVSAPPDLHFPPLKPSKTSSFVASYVAQLTEQQLKSIEQMFYKDYETFGYETLSKTENDPET